MRLASATSPSRVAIDRRGSPASASATSAASPWRSGCGHSIRRETACRTGYMPPLNQSRPLAGLIRVIRASGAGVGAQRVGLVGALPGEVGVVASEMAVGRGLLVDRAQQVEHLHDALR